MAAFDWILNAIFVAHETFIRRSVLCGAVAVLFGVATVPAFGQTPVLTQHNDNARTGQNTGETILNTSNVNVNQFGKLFALPVDGQVYAQPLYVPGVTINGGVHNVVIIATEADSVYAYDADSPSAVLLWPKKASLVDAAHGAGASEAPLNSSTTTPCGDMQPLIGITGTPVIDPTSQTIYVEAKSTDGTNYFHRLHALDLLTGNEKSPGPVVIAATVSGTGDGSSGGQLVFNSNLNAQHELNRPGLLLMNGTIYIAYGSHCDASPYHGWLFAYDAATFAMKSVYVTTPNGGLGGIWMSGAGVAADTSGNIFIASGNGDFDTTNVPARETGDTLLKLGTTNQILTQLDYFTPENQANMFANDGDLGSGGVLLLDQPGASFPHILVEAGKAGNIFVVSRDIPMTTNNSHYCSGCTSDPEILEESGGGAIGGMFNLPAYWNNTLYFWGSNDVLKSIPITNGLPDFTHITGGSPLINFPGAGLSVSSNGTTAGTAIVWAIDGTHYVGGVNSVGPSVLYAYDATNIANPLYSSPRTAGPSAAGTAVKFAVPTVTNGKVYVGTSTEVDVFGLLGTGPPTAATPIITPGSETFSGSVMVSMTDSTPGAAISYTTDGSIPPGSATSQTYGGSFTVTNTTVVNAVATATGFANSPLASATYTLQGTPSISSLSTTSGPVGTPVTITGTNFGSTQGTSTVTFNQTPASVTSWSATSLVTSVPSGATTGNVLVTVGGVASNGVPFTVAATPAPMITSLSATAGPAGTTVTIVGTNFGSSGTVTFNSTPATTTTWTSTSIATSVPSGATTGNVVVTVGGVGSNGMNFTVAPICGVSGQTGADGQNGDWGFGTPCVTGSNANGYTPVSFEYWVGNPTSASFDLGIYTDSSGSPGSLLCHTGTTTLTPAAGWNNLSLSGKGCPTLSANTRYWMGYITGSNSILQGFINGTCPGTSLNSVYTAAMLGSAALSTPFGANAGTPSCYSMYLLLNSITVSPSITSLSPTSGAVGAAVTITGMNFGSSGTVTFNGTPATTTTWTSTSIATSVPSGATTGNVVVTVGGVGSNGASFTVSPAPSITSLSPTSGVVGAAVTITGMNFGSSGTVTFNGTPTTTTTWTSTSIATSVPSGATTGNVVVTVGGVGSNGVSFTVSPAPSITSLSPTSGVVGVAVTITGMNFGSSGTVTFNGTPATTTTWTSTSIATSVPSGATTGNVLVKVGGIASNGASFSVTFVCGETGQTGTDSQNGNWGFASACVTGTDASGYTPASFNYWVGNPASASFDLGIYADSSGSPSSLLCHTGMTTVTPAAGWNNLSLSGKGCPTLSASTRYWMGYITASNTVQQGIVSGTCPATSLVSVYTNSMQGSAVLPNSFGATAGTPSCYSMYLVLNTK